MSTAPVTVIIPCLNAETTLAEAIQSVLGQTTPPLEIIVVDDGSTDRSVDVARSFGPQIRVLRNPQRGPGAARHIGVLEACGDFIAFIDADDVIEPTKHEQQLRAFERSGPDTLVHTGSLHYWPDGSHPQRIRTGGEQATGRCLQTIFERNPVCGASSMLRRETILQLGNYDPDLFGTEDFGMSLAAATRCEFVYLPEPLYRIRQHTTNLTRRLCHMAYFHWLAQERFRLRFPEAFNRLPHASVQQFMIEPVLRAVREAYYRRDGRDYRRLLALAAELAPDDSETQHLWRRRWLPMRGLRAWDRVQSALRECFTHKAEASTAATRGAGTEALPAWRDR